MWGLKLTLENISNGGTVPPEALTHPIIVTNTPLSADVTYPTWRAFLSAKTFGGLCTVVSPVSSIF